MSRTAEPGLSHSFPPPPAGAWHEDPVRVEAAAYLDRVEWWRSDLIRWLRSAASAGRSRPDSEPLSVSMCATLLRALGQPMPGTSPRTALELPMFPFDSDERCRVSSVLRWRATIVDVLADIWDVIGEPRFDAPECAVATNLFMPPTPDGLRFCPFCLTSWPSASNRDHSHFEECPFRD